MAEKSFVSGGEFDLTLKRGSGFTLKAAVDLSASGLTVLFGPSGCGKTTILRSVAGLERATGRVRIGDEVWQDSEKNIFLPTWKRPLGYVFQEASLFPHMTADQNIRFGLRYSRGKATTEERVAEAVKLLGLEKLLGHLPKQLSGGERQRVSIARALVLNPLILLMDEPLSALDWERRQEIMPWIQRIKEELQIPVLYVTHSMDELIRLGDYVVLMEQGSVVNFGTVNDVVNDITAGSLSEDAASLLIGTVNKTDSAYGLTHIAVDNTDGTEIVVPAEDFHEGQKVRIEVLARDVSIALSERRDTSIQNILPCVIKNVIKGSDQPVAKVELAVGKQTLFASVTRRACESLGLAAGNSVWAQVKSVAVKA